MHGQKPWAPSPHTRWLYTLWMEGLHTPEATHFYVYRELYPFKGKRHKHCWSWGEQLRLSWATQNKHTSAPSENAFSSHPLPLLSINISKMFQFHLQFLFGLLTLFQEGLVFTQAQACFQSEQKGKVWNDLLTMRGEWPGRLGPGRSPIRNKNMEKQSGTQWGLREKQYTWLWLLPSFL